MTPDQLTRHLRAYADAVEPFPPDLAAAARRVDRGLRTRTIAVVAFSAALLAGGAVVVSRAGLGGTRADRAAGSPTSPVYGFVETARVTLPYDPGQVVVATDFVAGHVWIETGSIDGSGSTRLWFGLPGTQLRVVATYAHRDASVSSVGGRFYVAESSSRASGPTGFTDPAISPALQEWDGASGRLVATVDLGRTYGSDGAAFPAASSSPADLVLSAHTTATTQQVRVAHLVSPAAGTGPSTLVLSRAWTYAGPELRQVANGGDGETSTAVGDAIVVTGATGPARPYLEATTVVEGADGMPRFLFAQGVNERALPCLDLGTGVVTQLVVAPHSPPDGGGESAGVDGVVDGLLIVSSNDGITSVDPATGRITASTHGYGNTEQVSAGHLYYSIGDSARATGSLDPRTLQSIPSGIRPVYVGEEIQTFRGTLTTSTDRAKPGPVTVTLYGPA